MQRRCQFAPGEIYHIYNRGNGKQTIFKTKSDHHHFQKLLYANNTITSIVFRDIPLQQHYLFERADTLVDIGAYCLMPNHFHILIHEKKEGGISNFMKKLGTSYGMYFNVKYNRTGGLFEGRFKAEHVDDDIYLNYLYAYIHLNPVKLIEPRWKQKSISNVEKTKRYLDTYGFSSYQEYVGNQKRNEDQILNREPFPNYFSETNFRELIDFWLQFKPSDSLN